MDASYLVLYDIADNRRLARAASIVLDYGIRLQKSVYEVRLNDRTLAMLRHRLTNVIAPEEDGVKIFPLCESCQGRRIACGASPPQLPETSPWVVI